MLTMPARGQPVDTDTLKIILHVEDDAILSRSREMSLNSHGYQVISAFNGEQAVGLFTTSTGIDLVLMDINLGTGMNGIQAAERILQHREVPLIFLLEDGEPEVVEKTEDITSYGYVVKASGEAVLLASIKMAFRLFGAKMEILKREAELRKSEERLSLAMDGSMDGLWDWNVSTGEVYCSPGYARMLGYSPEEIPPDPGLLSDLCHPEDRDAAINAIMGCVENRYDSFTVEIRMRTKSGYWRWILGRGKAVARDGSGRAVRVTGTNVDITNRKNTEEALRRSEDLTTSTLDTLSASICVLDAEGVILQVNQRWRDFSLANPPVPDNFGIGENYLAVCAAAEGDDAEEARLFAEGLQAVLEKEKEFYNQEYPCHSPTEQRWFHGRAIRFTRDDPVRVVVTHEDITKRKQLIESLAASEERFRLMFERHGAIMLLIDPTDGRIVDGNDSAAAFYGYTRDELKIMNIRQIDCLPPEELASLVEQMQTKSRCNFLAPHRLADGTIRTMEVHISVISTNDTPLNFAIFQDITDRIKAEADLMESNERFRASFETFPGGLTITGLENGVFFDANPGFEDISGYKRSEVVGKSSLALNLWHDPEDRAKVISVIKDKGVTNRMEVKVRRKDGSIRFVSLSGKIIRIKNQPLLFLFAEDVSERHLAEEERKRLEAQLLQVQKMEVIGQLTGCIAHDFNNLLTSIIGFSHILLNKIPPDSPLYPYVKTVFESGSKAADLTQSLLAFSRKQILTPEPTGLCETIQGFKKMLGRIIREDIEFRTTISENELTVMADKGQIEQVLMNFVTNANDAMPQGGTLTIDAAPFLMDKKFIKCHGFGTAGLYACVSVTDTGHGMDEETQKHLFEPFYTTKEPGKGTGLGMSIVYGIVSQHNGYINFTSKPGCGTTFRVYLPLLTEEGKKRRGAIKNPLPEGGTETILLVEDDETVQEIHRMILESGGYTVITASNGEDALAQFMSHQATINMLVTDVIMPKRDGNSLSKEIKKIQPDMPVLFLSGYAKDIVTGKGVRDDELNYIAKPAKPDELLAKVRDILDLAKRNDHEPHAVVGKVIRRIAAQPE